MQFQPAGQNHIQEELTKAPFPPEKSMVYLPWTAMAATPVFSIFFTRCIVSSFWGKGEQGGEKHTHQHVLLLFSEGSIQSHGSLRTGWLGQPKAHIWDAWASIQKGQVDLRDPEPNHSSATACAVSKKKDNQYSWFLALPLYTAIRSSFLRLSPPKQLSTFKIQPIRLYQLNGTDYFGVGQENFWTLRVPSKTPALARCCCKQACSTSAGLTQAIVSAQACWGRTEVSSPHAGWV